MRHITYFFCAMAKDPETGAEHYAHGTINTTFDPNTQDGMNLICSEIGKVMTPPRDKVLLIAFNRI